MSVVDAGALLAEAIAAHQVGQVDRAEAIYRHVLAEQPDQLTALHLLGLAVLQQGRLDEASQHLQRVVTLAPATADAWGHLATLYQFRGDDAAEAAALDQLLTLQPHQSQSWGRRGVLAFGAGQLEVACTYFGRAAELDPTNVDAWTNLGAAQLMLGRLAEAESSQRRAVAADPSSVMALNNLGNVLVARSCWDEAAPVLERVVQQMPDDPNGLINFGHALRGLRRYQEARAAYERALAFRPDDPAALVGLGFALHALGDIHGAIPHYERSIARMPENADPHEYLGVAMQCLGRLDEAEAAFRRCLALDPDQARVHSALILVLDLKQDAEAEAREERRRWNDRFCQPALANRPPHLNSPDPARRLRVGYVSADFRHHSAAYAILPVLRSHDHRQVEVVCYAGVISPDHVTDEIRALADRWRDVTTLPDDDLVAQIRADEIDILVDLSGHSGDNRLPVFAREPAPVQVTAWGYAASTGLEAMHYLLSDPIAIPPEDRASYTEEIVDLPSILCYEPPRNTPAVAPLPARTRGFVTFGAFNRLPKITDRALESWARVLLAVPSSRLVIKCAGADAPTERDRLLVAFAGHGIGPERVSLLGGTPQPEHLATHGEIDLMLDTFPQNGGITTLDALLMGVPVVTLLGERVTGRASASFLTTLGLTDLVARTTDEYVAVATGLAADLDRLEQERASLRDRLLASPLADAAQYTRAVEAAYRALWRRWCDRHAVSCELRVASGERTGTGGEKRGVRARAARPVRVTRRLGVAR